MKKHLLVLSALLCLGFQASAEDMGGAFTVASDYSWRGISLSNSAPAVQGDMYYSIMPALKFGVWAGNISVWSADTTTGAITSPFGGYETDPYLTYTHEMGEMSFYATAMWYTFARMANRNALEYTLGMNWKDLNVAVSYLPDFFDFKTAANEKNTSTYIQANYAHNCKDNFWAVVHVGNTSFSEEKAFSSSYTDVKLGAQLRKEKMTFEMAYVQTLGREDANTTPADKYKDSATIASATWSM